MSEFVRKFIAWLDATEPDTRLATYRRKLEQIEGMGRLSPERMAVYREFVTGRLDKAERVMQRDRWSPHVVEALLEEARASLVSAIHEPNAVRGAKTMRAAQAGHEARHGTNDEKKARWQHQQALVDEIAAANPALSWSAIRERAGQRAGVSAKTIQRHCKNPKES